MASTLATTSNLITCKPMACQGLKFLVKLVIWILLQVEENFYMSCSSHLFCNDINL